MGKYSKTLSGLGSQMLVAKAIAYTTDATYALFVDNAPEGEIGVFLSDGTLRTTALAAGTEFFVAQKRDGVVKKTPIIKYNEIFRKAKTAYTAPVKQITSVGYNGSSGDLGFDFSGATSSSPVEAAIEVRETTPGNQPFPIQEGRAVITSSSYDEYTALAQIVSQLNGDFDYENVQDDKFAIAEILSDGTITEFVEDATVTNGSTKITFAGNVTVATGAFVAIRSVVYKVTTGVTTGTSITIDRPYTGDTETIDVSTTVDLAGTITYTSGSTALGVKIRGINNETHFKVTVLDNIASAPVTETAAWKLGSGYGDSVVEMEKEGLFFEGIGSTPNAAFAADYGYPTLFASSSVNYHLYFVDIAPTVRPSAAAPLYEQKLIQRLIIACPTASGPDSELDTIFGF